MSIERLVNFYISKDLSGDEIKLLTGRPPVIYSDLKKFSSLSELLGNQHFVVLLYQTSHINNGHFVCLRENSNGDISFIDSYGYPYDSQQHVGADYDNALPRYLTDLIQKDGRPVQCNKFDYQRKSPVVSTCGRYACIFSLWLELSLEEIHRLLTTNSSGFLQNPDNLITILTILPLNDVRKFFEK